MNTVDKTTADEIKRRVPEPALIRGAVVAIVSLIGVVLGKQLDVSWIDPVLSFYTVVMPLALGWWIRRHVSPTAVGANESA